jgi:glycosyltransferase involved in cell wall biosynthesis
MSGSPDVSVVMSVYNGAAHLRETIESILSQEGVSLEFIIVNDGSTDASPQILSEYARVDSRIKIIDQENQGLTRSLIRGCAAAAGQYIARQDVGDVSKPQRLLLQKSAMDRDKGIAFVSCWAEYCGPEWEFLYLVKGTGKASLASQVIDLEEANGVSDGPTHHGSVMFRRDQYLSAGSYRPEFYYGQDWDLWYRLAESGKFQLIPQRLYKARLFPASISAGNKERQKRLGSLSLLALKQRQAGNPDKDVLRQASVIRPSPATTHSAKTKAQWLYFVGECLRQNHDQRSSAYFKLSILTYPLNIGSWLRLLQNSIRLR